MSSVLTLILGLTLRSGVGMTLAPGQGHAKYFLYDKQTSDFSPIRYYFNAAFDVTQNPFYFSQKNYFKNHKTLFRRITSPFHTIKKNGGYRKLIEDEFFSAPFFPNLFLHLIGSGHDSRLIYEYYKSHNYPYPSLLMVLTLYLAHFGNEANELSNSNIKGHDHIADLFFFNALGIIIFQSDGPVKFFRDKMNMKLWMYQPFIDVDRGQIGNAGLNYIFRPDVFKGHLRPFAFIGIQTLFGFSYMFAKEEFVSLSAGLLFTNPHERVGKEVFGAFYDTPESRIELFLNGLYESKVWLNIYPRFVRLGKKKYKNVGMTLALKNDSSLVLGLTFRLPLGAGKIF